MFTVLSFGQVTKVFSLLSSVIFTGLIWSSFFGHLNNPLYCIYTCLSDLCALPSCIPWRLLLLSYDPWILICKHKFSTIPSPLQFWPHFWTSSCTVLGTVLKPVWLILNFRLLLSTARNSATSPKLATSGKLSKAKAPFLRLFHPNRATVKLNLPAPNSLRLKKPPKMRSTRGNLRQKTATSWRRSRPRWRPKVRLKC